MDIAIVAALSIGTVVLIGIRQLTIHMVSKKIRTNDTKKRLRRKNNDS